MSIANNEQPRGCRDDAIKILRSRLKTKLKSGKVLRPSKRFIEFLLQLYANGRSEVIYTEVFKLNLGDLDKVLDSLIRRGYVSAIYIGPPKRELPQPCRNVKGIPKDPWVIDRRRSGAIKVWSFAYTGNERLRKRRRRCWGAVHRITIHKTPKHGKRDMQPKQRGYPGKNKNVGGKLHLGD